MRGSSFSCVMIDVVFFAGVYLHDPAVLLAAVNPSLVTCTEGVVRVQTNGITRGITIFDHTRKRSVQLLFTLF